VTCSSPVLEFLLECEVQIDDLRETISNTEQLVWAPAIAEINFPYKAMVKTIWKYVNS
jgi:hypothetical protein